MMHDARFSNINIIILNIVRSDGRKLRKKFGRIRLKPWEIRGDYYRIATGLLIYMVTRTEGLAEASWMEGGRGR